MKRVVSLLLSLMIVLMPMTCAQAQLALPGSVVAIEDEAFVGDGSISGNVTLPAGTKTVGDRTFANTDIYALWLPESVRSIGTGVLDGANAVYAVSMSPAMQVASGALDVPYLIGRTGTPAQAWAEANGVTFLNTSDIVWQGGFCYQLSYDAYGNHGKAKLLFARSEDVSGSVVIPEYVSGCTVSEVGSYAFARLDGVTEIHLPEAAAQPDTRVNWPDAPVTTYSGSQSESGMPEGATQVTFRYDHLTMVPGQSWWIGVMEELPEGDAQWIFESTNEAVVSVTEDGLAVAQTTGEARLSVTIFHESGAVYYGEVSVTVEEPEIDVWFYENEITIVAGSACWPQIDYSMNATFDGGQVDAWTESDNEEVVCVGENGELIGVAPGTAICTYTVNFAGAQDSDTITVHVREPELALNYYRIYAYETLQYQLKLTDELPEGAGVAFRSSDEEILTVDEDGLVSVLKEGMATVTCTVVYADGTTAQEECVFEVLGWMLEWASTEPIEVKLGETGLVWPGVWIWTWANHDSYANVTFEVEDESILSYERSELPLMEEKIATAHKLGTTNVTCTVSFNPPEAVEGRTITQTIPVTVVEPYMEAQLDPDWMEFDRVGDVCGLGYGYGGEIAIERAYFTSSDESVATVSPNGVVTARGVGEAAITYHIEALGIEKTASTQVVVHGKDLALSDSERTIARYESFTLVPVYDAGEGDDVSVNFMSSNPAIAYVDGEGVVSGVAAGTAVIICELNSNSGNSRAQCVVTVTDDAAAITLNRTELTLCRGDSFTLVPAFSGEATDVTFESSNEDLVTVDENGCVTAVTDWYEFDFFPYITCRATVDGKSEAAYCIVRYAEPDAFIAGIAGRISLTQDEMYEIGMFITSTGADAAYTMAYESADEHVATVDDAGVVTAVGAGVTTVTVRLLAPDGALYDTATVDVYVETPYTVPESLAFEHAHYLLNPEGTGPQSECNARAILYPQEMNRYYAIEYESLNPDVVGMEGDRLYAVQPGTADILATARYEEDGEEKILRATAKVTVAELYVEADKETYEPGEIATLTIANFPEDLDCEFINWYFPDSSDECRWISQDGPTLKVRVRQPGNYGFNVDIRVNDQWWHNFDYKLKAEGDWVEYRLSESDIRAAVGDAFGVWPQFGYAEITTVSSNPDVVTISEDDPCQMRAVGVGEAVITYTCTLENGEVKVLELNVTVAEPQWRMVSMDPIPDVMMLGCDYWCEMEMEYNGRDDLVRYVRYTISDETVAQVSEDNPLWIIPLSKGTFTLTATAEFAGRIESMSKVITVSQAQVYPQMTEIDLRSGFTFTMPLLTSGDREIDSVIWRSGDVNLASVDETGEVLVKSDEWQQVTIYADVTFTDGTKGYTSYRINIIPNSAFS